MRKRSWVNENKESNYDTDNELHEVEVHCTSGMAYR